MFSSFFGPGFLTGHVTKLHPDAIQNLLCRQFAELPSAWAMPYYSSSL
tara:strand:+ start:179783 stop:179926 length:144 start_codon:yes stop_codon:yes gene_type:complete